MSTRNGEAWHPSRWLAGFRAQSLCEEAIAKASLRMAEQGLIPLDDRQCFRSTHAFPLLRAASLEQVRRLFGLPAMLTRRQCSVSAKGTAPTRSDRAAPLRVQSAGAEERSRSIVMRPGRSTHVDGRRSSVFSVLAVCVCMIYGLLGCSSMSSTYVGHAAPGLEYEGMPIVVQRPKYLKVTYVKVTSRVYANFTDGPATDRREQVAQVGSDITATEIRTEIVSVGEVFTLDLKRPASGTTDFNLEFAAGTHYPSKVGAKIDDRTIESIGTMLGDVVKAAGDVFMLASSGKSAKADKVIVSEEVTRIELRSLDDPSIVYQVFP